jgi:hypothetical protein
VVDLERKQGPEVVRKTFPEGFPMDVTEVLVVEVATLGLAELEATKVLQLRDQGVMRRFEGDAVALS